MLKAADDDRNQAVVSKGIRQFPVKREVVAAEGNLLDLGECVPPGG